jgi:glycosyltransferase involved in cell wall biosynthesis
MKILFFIEGLLSGGKERRLVELIKGLKQYPNIEMELVLTKKEIVYDEIFDTGIKIHYAVRKGIKKDPRLFYKFYQIVKRSNPDIIHVWGNMVAVYAIPAKLLLRLPMINNQITDAPLQVKKGLLSSQLTFKFSDRIIANTKAGLKSYNAPIKKSNAIYNGFDFGRVEQLKNKEEIRARFNISTPFIVGMAASFSVLKDYSTYITAANKVLENRNDVTFLCIGAGDDSKYREMVEPKNKDKVLFLGRQQNVENIMNICDIGVLASFTEGLSNSLMEFMALGKPVIASGQGGIKELVDDGKNGFVLESKNPDKLAQKINLLLNEWQLRLKMSEKNIETIKEKFGIKRMIEEFYQVYIEIGNQHVQK